MGSGEVRPKRSKEFVLTTHSIFYTQATLHHDVPTMHLDEVGDVCIRPGCFPPACPASTAQTSHVLSPPLPSIPTPTLQSQGNHEFGRGRGDLGAVYHPGQKHQGEWLRDAHPECKGPAVRVGKGGRKEEGRRRSAEQAKEAMTLTHTPHPHPQPLLPPQKVLSKTNILVFGELLAMPVIQAVRVYVW